MLLLIGYQNTADDKSQSSGINNTIGRVKKCLLRYWFPSLPGVLFHYSAALDGVRIGRCMLVHIVPTTVVTTLALLTLSMSHRIIGFFGQI